MLKGRVILALAMAAAIVAFFAFDLGRFFSLDYLKSQQTAIETYQAAHPVPVGLVFFGVYLAVTALSLPGAAIMTIAGGAIFGLLWGTVIVSFASSMGATLAFLASRFLLRESVQRRFADRLGAINRGVELEGAFYLFTLRLVPVFPFFVINLLMGLTPLKAATFYWVSQLGMLLGTAVYVNAGTQLARIDSLKGILSPGLLASFALLGALPLVARTLVRALEARKIYARWPRPARFDRNVVVIGAGSAGLVAAYIAATVKAKVTLVERDRMGGDCLNSGCVPSKALIRTAKLLSNIRHSKKYGIQSATATFEFADVMDRIQAVIARIEPHDSAERYAQLGVDVVRGEARVTSPWTLEVRTDAGVQALTTRSIVIAAGARPRVPPIPGLDKMGCLTSDTIWSLRELPARLLVLGGGPIGCELAQAFARLGSQVTQVEMLPRIMVREDPEVSEVVAQKLREDGVTVLVAHEAKAFQLQDGEKTLVAEHDGKAIHIRFDEVLCAVGRVANTKGYGLEALGIGVTAARTIETNQYLQTIYPNIFAAGDVAGPYQFTHTASHQAWYAAVNALFGTFRMLKADYSVIPWATFTDPEVARVGLNETEAKERGVPHQVTVYPLDELDRAIADSDAYGMVKVLTVPSSDRILGATIVSPDAGNLIQEFISAMKSGIGLNEILSTIHIYPTLMEANKAVAGSWKRSTVTEGQMAFLESFQAWRRGVAGLGPLFRGLRALLTNRRLVASTKE